MAGAGAGAVAGAGGRAVAASALLAEPTEAAAGAAPREGLLRLLDEMAAAYTAQAAAALRRGDRPVDEQAQPLPQPFGAAHSSSGFV